MTQKEALEVMKMGVNVFLTGEPGSGKSFAINSYVKYLKDHGVEPAVTASTGIAATHIAGYTIHSWSGIGIRNHLDMYELEALNEKQYLVKRIRKTKVLIIDEVSMLDGRILDTVDMVMKTIKQNELPFGGVQVILVGDFFQLPPVSRDRSAFFAFESESWTKARLATCYLTEQFRQEDENICELLSAFRRSALERVHYEMIESRICTDESLVPKESPKLFSHNNDVDRVNDLELEKIDEEGKLFVMDSKGRSSLVEQLKKGCLSPERLNIKIGAVVMCTKNNFEAGFVNGTVGVVESVDRRTGHPVIKTKDNRRILVSAMEWSIDEDGKVLAKVTQIPLRLAWAITVHKSQGVSLDSALIDLSRSFEFGQGYVALSRLRSLDGLFCLGYNERAFEVNPKISEVDEDFRKSSLIASKRFGVMKNEEVIKKQDDFLLSSGGCKDIETKQKTKKKTTYDVTAEMVKFEAGLESVAKARKLTVTTVLGHLEKLIQSGSIKTKDIKHLWNDRGRNERELQEILKVFTKSKDGKLRPVYDKLNGKYDFVDLRLARILRK